MARCDQVQDRLPEFAAGRLDGGPDGAALRSQLRVHLEGCAECRSVHETVALLAAAPPRPVPAALESRIIGALRLERIESTRPRLVASGRRRPARWALAAAAGVALAVATPLMLDRFGPGAVDDDPQVAALLTDALPSPWLGEEGMVAGAPVLDDLSDAALEQLLLEME